MRLAAFQMIARTCDVDANLGMLDGAAAEAKGRGAKLLVAPELATTGYGAADAIRDLAEPVDGRQGSAITAMATRHGLTIVAGFPERAGDAIYNSALLVMPNGRQFIYRKCHLYGCYERKLFAPAESRPLMTELDGIKIGILICYDVEFPEAGTAPRTCRCRAPAGSDCAARDPGCKLHHKEACSGTRVRERHRYRLCKPCRRGRTICLRGVLMHFHARRQRRYTRHLP